MEKYLNLQGIPQQFLLVIVTVLVAMVLRYITKKIIRLYIKNYAAKLNTDPTNFAFLNHSVGFVIYTTCTIFIIYKIPYLRSLGTAMFAGAGVFALVVGLASQKAFANIISGVFILVFKPFKMTDIIEFKDGSKGVVEDITLRHTIIKDYENRRIIIPNSVISEETIINSNINDEKIRQPILFGISYDSDIDLAIKIIQEEAMAHPSYIDNRTAEAVERGDPSVIVRVVALSDFSVDLKAHVWGMGNDESYGMKCDLLKSIKERFDREGIEIPFPHRTIIYKKD